MNVTQDLVDRIVNTAKNSNYGLDKPENERALCLHHYTPKNEDTLALMLVTGWTSKYDLVSIVAAAIKETEKQVRKELNAS